MITILASIVGFISSLIPEILKFFKDQNDKKHELQILDRQISQNRMRSKRVLEEIEVYRDISEQHSLYSTYKSGVSWVDALNGTVRPVMAYSFFLIYAGVKIIQYKALTSTYRFIEFIEIIWNIDDQAIFAGIISFYFGQRTFNKLQKNRG